MTAPTMWCGEFVREAVARAAAIGFSVRSDAMRVCLSDEHPPFAMLATRDGLSAEIEAAGWPAPSYLAGTILVLAEDSGRVVYFTRVLVFRPEEMGAA